MFVFTAKINKKKLYLISAIIIIVLACVLVAAALGGKSTDALSESAVIKTNDKRVEYLTSLGWEIDPVPIDEQKIIIPSEFTEVYEKYNSLQLEQGFDLKKYCGKECSRYSYSVLNHPECKENVVADIIVYRGKVIAGDVQSLALNGFMSTLDFPGKETSKLY